MCRSSQFGVEVARLEERAKELFWLMSGFSTENLPTVYQEEDFNQVHELVKKKIQINAKLKKIESISCFERYMKVNGRTIYYDLPLKDYIELLQGAYVFLVSEDSLEFEEQNTIEQLYAHIWQNAYLDAAREWMQTWIEEQEDCYVSSGVAPGFYGIELSYMKEFYELIHGEEMGVALREDGMLEPEKSVLGMHFLLKEAVNIFGKRCAECPAMGKNCLFCMNKY